MTVGNLYMPWVWRRDSGGGGMEYRRIRESGGEGMEEEGGMKEGF